MNPRIFDSAHGAQAFSAPLRCDELAWSWALVWSSCVLRTVYQLGTVLSVLCVSCGCCEKVSSKHRHALRVDVGNFREGRDYTHIKIKILLKIFVTRYARLTTARASSCPMCPPDAPSAMQGTRHSSLARALPHGSQSRMANRGQRLHS